MGSIGVKFRMVKLYLENYALIRRQVRESSSYPRLIEKKTDAEIIRYYPWEGR